MRLHFVDVLYFPSMLHENFHHFSIRFFVPTIILLLVFVFFMLLCLLLYLLSYYFVTFLVSTIAQPLLCEV
jgi:hypothetical protein